MFSSAKFQYCSFTDMALWSFFSPWDHLPETTNTASVGAMPVWGTQYPGDPPKWFQQFIHVSSSSVKLNNQEKVPCTKVSIFLMD